MNKKTKRLLKELGFAQDRLNLEQAVGRAAERVSARGGFESNHFIRAVRDELRATRRAN